MSVNDEKQMRFESNTPIYLQIAEDIRRRILDGDLQPGSQLMSTTQYATTYRINPATANKAFAILQAEGLVYKQRGIGMFITDDAPALLRAKGQKEYLDSVLLPAINHGLALGFDAHKIQALVLSILEEHK
ncbi:GntR family transcriptional regulator [Arcanobacterium pinnipediorum]|uniref:GntR family transcriptional regulator n=2 Tax=Arcanobacterium pinnipediorum TaxID=1503041 RepID=A0ABY5AIE2_9ACTO|nr:GntR family transcriptional regulator [Arcanobacterium pinnipediorum]USR79765.1 GntR family transcriptional regulator [Arcanobacterium pinnipediorum]